MRQRGNTEEATAARPATLYCPYIHYMSCTVLVMLNYANDRVKTTSGEADCRQKGGDQTCIREPTGIL